MSLGKCPKCEAPLADNAFKCQSCGHQTFWGRVQPLLTVSWWIGTGFILERPAAFNGLAIYCGLMLTLGIVGAWELLLWMVTRVHADRGEPSK